MFLSPFERSLDRLRPVSLAELSTDAPLMRRYDHKYVTTESRAEQFIASLDDDWGVLLLGGGRSLRYHTIYLDDPHRRTFRDHLQGRRPRFKVRTRTYQDGTSFLEVKLKTGRGQTDKSRIPRVPESEPILTEVEHSWLARLLPDFDTRALRPALEVDCQRVTLHSPTRHERVTIDHSMMVTSGGELTPLVEGGVVIETKSETFRGRSSHVLADLEIRSVSFSKYCAGLSVVDPTVHPRIRVEAERAARASTRT